MHSRSGTGWRSSSWMRAAARSATRLRARRPRVELVESARQPIPRLRHLGVCRARGRIVAILEDHGRVAPDWATSVLKAHQGPWGAVGGAVENGRHGLVNWAVFFCEYTPYMGPVVEGEATDLPGNNIAYKRPHLMRHAHVLAEGKWESWINDRLRADGVATRLDQHHRRPPHQAVPPRRTSSSSGSTSPGRTPGCGRCDQSPWQRLIYGVGSPALPALLLARVTRTVVRKRRHLGRFALGLALVALFLTVGAFGEMIGYLFGPGASLDKVE